MAYFDVDRRRDGLLPPLTGSFTPAGMVYQVFNAAGSETRLQFPYESEWIQITATTTDDVKWALRYGGTGGSNYGVVIGQTSSGRIPVRTGEIYVLNDAAVTVGLTNVLSGSQGFSYDKLY